MCNVMSILNEGRRCGQTELAKVDQSIVSLSSLPDSKDNPAVTILLQGRDRLQRQLDELECSIARVKAAGDGSLLAAQQDGQKPVIPGQYSGMKLSTAVQAYLSERGRGPVNISVLVKDLTAGGFKVIQSRAIGPKKGSLRDPDTRDLRLLANNNRMRFSYDSTADTIALRPAPGNDTSWKTQS